MAQQFRYETDLLGNMQSIMSGLQGYDILALEIIQNADDAEASELVFDVTDDALKIANNRSFSSCGLADQHCAWESAAPPEGRKRRCDFHAIMRIGGRNKVVQEEKIGRFGIGFVSVFQVTDTPIIRSGPTEIKLIPVSGDIEQRDIADVAGTAFELPWARTQTLTRDGLNASPVPDDVCDKMVRALDEVTARSLIFLRHLQTIEVRRNGQCIARTSLSREGDLVIVTHGDATASRWLLLEGDAAAEVEALTARFPTLRRLARRTNVTLAFPIATDSPPEGLLYAYLPTEQPSGLPCHVNADFFPHPNRRAVVLSGEAHERYFNEALLTAAGRAIADNLLKVRDMVGVERLWETLTAALESKERRHLYWDVIKPKAAMEPLALTVEGGWSVPPQCLLPSTQMTEAEDAAAARIGLALLAPNLRAHRNALANLGAQPLNLTRLVAGLEAWAPTVDEVMLPSADLEQVWRLVDTHLAGHTESKTSTEATERLAKVPFLLDEADELVAIADVYLRPATSAGQLLRAFELGIPFASTTLHQFPHLADEIDRFTAASFASQVSAAITTPDDAKRIIGSDLSGAMSFYDLFPAFDRLPGDEAAIKACLASTPFLPARDSYVPPSKAVFPSDFTDPLGRFTFIDKRALSPVAETFVRQVLGVEVLTFSTYVEEHLADIMAGELSRPEYQRLLTALVRHHASLFAAGLQDLLAETPLVRTRAGAFALAKDVYIYDPELVALFGDTPSIWLDPAWVSLQDTLGAREFFEHLGMPRAPAIEHLVARIEELVEEPPEEQPRAAVARVVRFILDQFSRLTEDKQVGLEALTYTAWLPAVIDGKPDLGQWYEPSEIFQPFRSPGFESQAPVVDLAGLRTHTAGQAFLAYLEVPAEPPTSTIVDHLLHCIRSGIEPNDTTYAMLNERTGDSKHHADLERLRGQPFIFDRAKQRFWPAKHVFWERPPLGNHWLQASSRMHQMEALYNLLGVKAAPEASDFADLLVMIASDHGSSAADKTIELEVDHCLRRVAEAMAEQVDLQAELAAVLRSAPSLLTVAKTFAYPDEVAWIDAPWLAEPFDGDIDALTVLPLEDRPLSQRLFDALGVQPLSQVVQMKIEVPEQHTVSQEATLALMDRAELIVRMAPSATGAADLREALDELEVVTAPKLYEHAEFLNDSGMVVSKPRSTEAFYDAASDYLILRAAPGDLPDWSQGFKALLTTVFVGARVDLRPLVLAAAYIVTAPTYDLAERSLAELGYAPWAETEELEGGVQLADQETDEIDTAAHNDDSASQLSASPEVASEPSANAVSAIEQTSASSPPNPEKEPEEVTSNVQADEGGRVTGGAPGQDHASAGWSGASSASNSKSKGSPIPSAASEANRARSSRNERMLTYVGARSSADDANVGGGRTSGFSGDVIDEAAMSAVLKYEVSNKRQPERKAHNHPGFDIVSTCPTSHTQRLIEVKGLEGAWNARGVKLSATQYVTAQKNLADYWLYIVEFAPDPAKQQVIAVQNPFSKVQEYWFDDGWRGVAEHSVKGAKLHAVPGAVVRHEVWGPGKIVRVNDISGALQVVVEFGMGNGTKALPLSKVELVG